MTSILSADLRCRRAGDLIERAEYSTDSKEAAKLLDLAAEQLELAEGELASQQHQEAQLKKS